MGPEYFDKRPSAQEYAEHLLASFDLSPESESEIIRDALRQRLAHDAHRGESVDLSSKVRSHHEDRFTTCVDGHLSALKGFKENAGIDVAGRLISEISFRRGESEKPDVVGLIDIRGRDGRSIAMTETRLFVMEEGVAMVEGRSFHRGHGFTARTLLAPRTYSAELERVRKIAEEGGGEGEGLKTLERSSLLYHLMRGTIADRHGSAASWYRGISAVLPVTDSESDGFLFRIAPHSDFFARPHYEPATCRVFIETRRC